LHKFKKLKIKDYILSFFITLIFIISTSGVNYIEHICNLCGFNDVHLFVAQEHKHDVIEKENSCCSSETNFCCSNFENKFNEKNITNKNCNLNLKCCDFKNKFIKISDNYINQIKPIFNVNFCFLNLENFILTETKVFNLPFILKENYYLVNKIPIIYIICSLII